MIDLTRFSDKFTELRDVQVQVLESLLSTDKQVMMAEAPTGIGKSLIAMGLHQLLRSRFTVVSTGTISLQQQYLADFPSAVGLVGKRNFTCTRTGLPVSEAPCAVDPNLECESEYYEQERNYRNADCVVTNYALFASELLHGKRWFERRPQLLVCDEGHRLLDYLTSAETVQLDGALSKSLGLDTPDFVTLPQTRAWVKHNIGYVKSKANAEVFAGTKKAGLWVGLMRQMGSLVDAPDNLIVTMQGQHFQAVPLWPKASAAAMAGCADRILIMSATLYGGTFLSKLLGIDDYHYISSESPFPTDNWPVYYTPIANMSKKAGPELWNKMGEQCHVHMHQQQERGIIHVASFSQAEQIAKTIRRCATCRKRLQVQRLGERRDETIQNYKKKAGAWLIHPSVGEGESFDDDLCRTQLIAKVPYPDLSDPVINLRSKDKQMGQQFYFHSTAAKIVQMVGRGMRHEEDHCETYILDGSFGTLYDRNKSAFPVWFQRQLR